MYHILPIFSILLFCVADTAFVIFTKMPKSSRLGKFVLYAITWSLYLVIGMYLLIRAEGYQINFKDISFVETAVIALEMDQQATVQLHGHSETGKEVEFPDITPGRHIVKITSKDYQPFSATMSASPRSVSRLTDIHLTPISIKTRVISNDARLVTISEKNRFAAVKSELLSPISVYDLYASNLERVYTIDLPADFELIEMKWNDKNKLVLASEDMIMIANQNGIIKNIGYPGLAKKIIPIPNADDFYILTDANDLYLISFLDNKASLVLGNISTMDIDAENMVRIIQNNKILSPSGDLLSSPLPKDFNPTSLSVINDAALAWDNSGNTWINKNVSTFNSKWIPGPYDIRGAILNTDNRIDYFYTSGNIISTDFTNLFSGSNMIIKGYSLNNGLILAQTNSGLLHCSISLRVCNDLLENVDLLWSSDTNTVIKRGDSLELITSKL